MRDEMTDVRAGEPVVAGAPADGAGMAVPGRRRPGGVRGLIARLGPAGVAVTAAGLVVNALGYVVPLLGARQLTADGLSTLATVLAIGAIATVPGLGLQAALAVEWARRGGVSNATRGTVVTAAATAAALLVALPVLLIALRLPVLPILLLIATTVAVVLASQWLGEFQGTKRFGLLALAMATVAFGRYGGVVVGLSLGWGVTGSLALGAGVGWLVLPGLGLIAHRSRRASHDTSGRLTFRAVAEAGGATLAMLATSYADLILARNLLPSVQSGGYAVGSVLTKGALWAPQVVTVLVLPWLAQGSRRALAAALGAVAACGVVLVLASWVAGDFAMLLAGGGAYSSLGPYAVGFAAVGALYAVAFVLVNAEVAAKVRWPGAPLWIALVALVLGTRLLPSPTLGTVLATSVATATLAVLIMSVSLRLRRRAQDRRNRPAVGASRAG
jgi:O-antigen/teichoic acid export membrane protein